MRSTAERNGDGFAELIDLAIGNPGLPEQGGEPVTLNVTMTLDALRTGIGAATLADGATIPAASARRMACDAGVLAAVLGRNGEVLDMSSRARSAPASLRRRLALRDKGCAFPACARPPAQTQAHHVQYWANGGTTALDNTVLLCATHHRKIHHTPWSVTIRNGRPEFTPPDIIKAKGQASPTRRDHDQPAPALATPL